MASFITWIKENLNGIVESFPSRFISLRDKATEEKSHRKLPEQTAYLKFSLEVILLWLKEKNILTAAEILELSKEGWDTFVNLASKQGERINNEDPIKRFHGIINILIKQGKVKFEHKEACQADTLGPLEAELLGWYDTNYFYFLPVGLWHSIQKYCHAEQSHFPFSKHTLYGQLKKKGISETNDNQTSCAVNIKGKTTRVLKISRGWYSENQ